ncbi:hypothetical protein BASA81_002407 [Batrachochytrium salamandrivorans]|nr:hypothetical protein BASA81_002407 [Batrachochytrium salamandrivorans]
MMLDAPEDLILDPPALAQQPASGAEAEASSPPALEPASSPRPQDPDPHPRVEQRQRRQQRLQQDGEDGDDDDEDAAQVIPHEFHIAKLYRLGEQDKEWQELGFYRVQLEFVERFTEQCVVLVDNSLLVAKYEIPITRVEYKRDHETTIITWQDVVGMLPTTDSQPLDMALSFEGIDGCNKIWEAICLASGKISSDFKSGVSGEGEEDVDGTLPLASPDRQHSHYAHQPTVSRDNLDQFVIRLRNSCTHHLFRTRFASDLTNPDNRYGNFTKLLDMFQEIDREPASAKRIHELSQVYELFKQLALLDNELLFGLMLREENFTLVAGCLESDPTLPFRAEHRQFLAQANFHHVCPIANGEIVAKIHYKFRLGFLRDVLLPRALDDSSSKLLNGMDNKVSCEIALGLHQDDTFLPELFRLMLHPITEEERAGRHQAVQLFAEFNSLVQKLGPMQRSDVYKTMFVDGQLFDLVLYTLFDSSSSAKEKLDFEQVLHFAIKQDSVVFQERMIVNELLNDASKSLMGILVNLVTRDRDLGVQAMACNLLEILLDPETHSSSSLSSLVHHPHLTEVPLCHPGGNGSDGLHDPMDDIPFFRHFYAKHFMPLLQVLLTPGMTSSETLHLVTSVVCFCIQTHGYVIRQVLAENQDRFAQAITNLSTAKDKILVLDSIRFVRVLVGMKESFYDNFVMEHRVLDLMLQRFVEFGGLGVDNLVQSAVIDLFETIYSQSTRHAQLGNPLLAEYAAKLPGKELKHFKTFSQLDGLRNGLRRDLHLFGEEGEGEEEEPVAMASPQNLLRPFHTHHPAHDEMEAAFLGVGEMAAIGNGGGEELESPSPPKKPRLDGRRRQDEEEDTL